MKTQQFKITLQEDVVISERAATEGGHTSLDYLPGANFLGAVAAHLYTQLPEKSAHLVFNSGKVRFGNALPLSEENQLTYPMPSCWYKKKGKESNGNMVLINYQRGKYLRSKYIPEQMRGGYVSLGAIEKDNRFTKIVPRYRMKTALDREYGTAKEGQLFGYSSLPAGQQFIFNLEADDEIEQNLFEQIVSIFQEKPLKLGRSRSAEYGAIKLELSEQKDERILPQAASEVTLWLLADAALQDKFWQPTLSPTAASVGLPPHFELSPAKSFIRSRSYAPFNAHYRRRELERLVLSMGSVLHFSSKYNKAIDDQTLQSLQNQGIGLYRQAGLGRIWINPPLLASKSPKFATLKRPPKEEPSQLETPNHPVFRYLNKRKEQATHTNTIETRADDWKKELKDLYKSARKISSTAIFGPTKTQWGTVMEIAKNATSAETLAQNLFAGEHVVCKETDSEWSQRIFDAKNQQIDNFRNWLKNKIETENRQELLPQIVARFAHLARDVADEHGH